MGKSFAEIAKEREEFVAMSNEIVRGGHFDLTAQQLKIILYIISKIKPDDDVDTWYTIEIVDLCRCCGIKLTGSTYYTRLKADLKKLTFRKWYPVPNSADEYSLSWLGDVKLSKGSGTVTIIFNPFMGPYLFQLKENYTQYELLRILTFESKYSIRLYMLLKSYIYLDKLKKNIPQQVTLDVDWLRNSFVPKGYEDWRDFSKRILYVGIEEINEKSDEFHIEMETIKDRKNNRIENVKFILTPATTEQTDNARKIRKEKLKDE